jgi:ribonuclease H2 subunit A
VRNLDPVFGFPDLVRFSWQTTKTILADKGHKVEWGDEDEDDGNMKIFDFLKPAKKQKRCEYFASRGMESWGGE